MKAPELIEFIAYNWWWVIYVPSVIISWITVRRLLKEGADKTFWLVFVVLCPYVNTFMCIITLLYMLVSWIPEWVWGIDLIDIFFLIKKQK